MASIRTAEQINAEICENLNKLGSSASDIGDWKVAKIYEARLQNKEDPYDAEALLAARQAVRDTINSLQEELATVAAE